jgi:hypothetical protein
MVYKWSNTLAIVPTGASATYELICGLTNVVGYIKDVKDI